MEDPVSRELNLENLAVISSAMPMYWESFIFYGTLLGFHRDKNIIENDDDLDIMVERKHRNELIQIAKVYTPFDVSIDHHDIVQLTRHIKGVQTYVDIYFYDNIADKDYIVDQWNTDRTPITTVEGQRYMGIPLKIPKSMIFPIKQESMQDILLNVPNNPEECCRYVYGESFMIPSDKHSGGYFDILKPS